MAGRRFHLPLLLCFALIVLFAVWLAIEPAGTAGSSSLSRGHDGWIGARLYAEARGRAVELLDHRIDADDSHEVVVTVFPWSRMIDPPVDSLADFARAGKTLVVGHTGDPNDPSQEELFIRLGLEWETVREEPPLGPWAWKRYVTEDWSIRVVGSEREGRVTATRALPVEPRSAEILAHYLSGPAEGRAAAFRFSFGAGWVVVLPANALSNARLDDAGNADLLERLVHDLALPWAFDEYVHGLIDPETIAGAETPLAFDLFLIHLLILYVLAVYLFGRRFGPAWTERLQMSRSTSSFLLGLGSLHDRLGHHGAAVRLLLSRVRALEPRVELPESLDRRAASADRDGFVRIAREVAARRGNTETKKK